MSTTTQSEWDALGLPDPSPFDVLKRPWPPVVHVERRKRVQGDQSYRAKLLRSLQEKGEPA